MKHNSQDDMESTSSSTGTRTGIKGGLSSSSPSNSKINSDPPRLPDISEDSFRGSSVKNDHTPLVTSGSSGSPKSLLPDATPTPSSNLHLPRDRRPLRARGSNNSDSIEDYIRNWKKNDSGTSPLHSPGIESVK